MAKVISQETFDDVVKENIVEFSMDIDEAKRETVQQFEAQGVNLANIIQDLSINETTGRPVLNETIDQLKEISFETNLNGDELSKLLDILTEECAKSIPHRVMAAKLGALEIIVALLETAVKSSENVNSSVSNIIRKAFVAWSALVKQQPDIFDDKSLFLVITVLQKQPDDELILLILQLLRHATLMHETNRQNIMNAEIMTHFRPLIKTKNENILKETCAVFRHLILDDDVRVEFSKAHEHARLIASDVLVELTELLPVHDQNKDVLNELILTIAALTVRHELCLTVEEAGGLTFLLNAMRQHADSTRLVRDALKLLRALAGHDSVKNNILKNGAAKQIDDLINLHKSDELFARSAMICFSTLTLRSKENSQLLYDVGAAETIVETMKLHPTSKIVQRNGAWAIRNMVSRSRDQCPAFLTHGVEEVLTAALELYPDISYDIKSALRDLGCEVTLREEWKGIINKMSVRE